MGRRQEYEYTTKSQCYNNIAVILVLKEELPQTNSKLFIETLQNQDLAKLVMNFTVHTARTCFTNRTRKK